MSTATLEPTVEEDAFGGGLDQFFNPETKAPVKEAAAVADTVVETQTEIAPTVEPKKEVKVEEKPKDLLAGISDDAEPAEEQEETKEYPPEIRSIKAREHFDALKASKRAAEKRATEFEARIKELESKSGVKAPEVSVLQKQYDELKAKYDEQNKVVASIRIEETEDFKNRVTIPIQEASTELIALRDLNNLSSTDLDKALEEPDRRKRNILLSELAESIEGRLNQEDFFNAAKKFIEARNVEKELYENAEGSMEFANTKKQEEEAAAKLKAAEDYKQARETVTNTLKTRLPELQESPEVWEKIVADSEKVDWETLQPKMKAYAAISMNAIPAYKELIEKHTVEIKRLNGIIASRNAASPGVSSSSVARTDAPKGDFVDGLSNFQ